MTMIIGEIGINHNGDIELAKELIMMAKSVGIDVVKFQKRNPDICVPENQKNIIRDTPWGKMTYLEYKKKIEFGRKEYDEINKLCEEIGLKWTASVWDTDSLKFISKYNIPFIKIPSAMLTDFVLLGKLKEYDIPVIISTGMSDFEEIVRAVNFLYENNPLIDLTILQCNSTYPSRDDELDLNSITLLKELYPEHKIGYSGHEVGITPSIIAATLGAEVIERHITMDRTMWGTDQMASLEPIELEELVGIIRMIPIWLGNKEIKCYDSEEIIRNKLRLK